MGCILGKVCKVCLTVFTFHVVRFTIVSFYYNIFAPLVKNIKLEEMGKWAVVTDACDGIGRAYAEVLAEKGMDIVLIGNEIDELNTIASKVASQFRVKTKVIQADFTGDTADVFGKLECELCTLDIGVLVNNFSRKYPHPEYFLDLPHGKKIYEDIVKYNVSSLTNMTLIVLPRMVERGRGVIVNLSASAAVIPSPLLTVFGASEAYVEKFSRDLACEYSGRGVIIQCQLPGIIASNRGRIPRKSWLAPTPKEYVTRAVCKIGIERQTTGYFPHTVILGFIYILQCFSTRSVDWLILRTMRNIRNRAIQTYMGY